MTTTDQWETSTIPSMITHNGVKALKDLTASCWDRKADEQTTTWAAKPKPFFYSDYFIQMESNYIHRTLVFCFFFTVNTK